MQLSKNNPTPLSKTTSSTINCWPSKLTSKPPTAVSISSKPSTKRETPSTHQEKANSGSTLKIKGHSTPKFSLNLWPSHMTTAFNKITADPSTGSEVLKLTDPWATMCGNWVFKFLTLQANGLSTTCSNSTNLTEPCSGSTRATWLTTTGSSTDTTLLICLQEPAPALDGCLPGEIKGIKMKTLSRDLK